MRTRDADHVVVLLPTGKAGSDSRLTPIRHESLQAPANMCHVDYNIRMICRHLNTPLDWSLNGKDAVCETHRQNTQYDRCLV